MNVYLKKDIHKFAGKIPANSMNKNEENGISSKNFDLTENQFNILVNDLSNGSEQLFEKAFLNHFERSMNYLINKNGANREVAYDITMNTLIEFRKRIMMGKVKYGNLNFLFTQMCSQRFKKEVKRKVDYDKYSIINSDNPAFDEETYTILEETIEKLGENCQDLIQDVYYQKRSYKDLEDKYQKAVATLRKQKERCITKLKMLIRQKLNTI